MSQENVDLVVDFTNRILESSGLNLKAVAQTRDDGVRVQVHGDDVALLLGRNAELLDALEYLGSRMLARSSGDEGKLVFDSAITDARGKEIDTYRARRERELRLMAEKAAEKVRTSRIPFSFDPMTPNERRIVHLALSSDESVTTESQGNGENRKVTVRPAS
jgi:spoIIIJ-associated protein